MLNSLVRARTMHGFGELVAELGGDPKQVLRRAGLDANVLNRLDDWISFRSVVIAYEVAASTTNCGDFGIQLAARRDLSFLGPMVLIFKYSKDLEQGLQSCIQYIRAHNTGYEPVLDIGRKTASWEMRLDNKLRAHADQWIEESVLTATKLARIFLGDSYQPKAVYCQHERIKGTDYPRYFGTAIEFGAPFDGIILDREDLRSPNPINDQEVHRFLLGYLDARVLRADKDLAGAVHSLLTKLIPTGKFSIDVVADQLAVHRRTLQRRLRDTGSNFAELLDECRAQMARDILLNSDVPMANLAQMLGYADQSAFNHAFRRWYKTTPSRWSERRRR